MLSAILALTIISFLLGLLMNKTQSVLMPTILHFATKANMPTLAVTLTLVIIADLTWKKFYIDKKLSFKGNYDG